MRCVFRSARVATRLLSGVLLTASLTPRSVCAQTPPLLPAAFVDDTLVTGLDEPNSMAFLPDGRLLFTELKSGRIRMIVDDHVAASDPLVVVNSLNAEGNERGLQGIAIDPRWPAAPFVYAAYTRMGGQTVLVRYAASGELDDPAGEALALGDPLVVLDGIRDAYENHNGLGLRFDRDGYLLFSLGEDSDPCAAQHVDSLGGKLLRLDVVGLPASGGGTVPRAQLVPPDPVFDGPDVTAQLVQAYGLRNPWRFHVDSVDGTIALADVGWNQFEEVNEVVRGGNYGWPLLEGPVPGPPVPCTPDGTTLLPPIATWVNGVSSIAVLTAGIYRPVPTGTHNWPAEFWGDVFHGDYYHSRLRRLRRTAGAWGPAPPASGQPTADDFALGLYWAVDFLVGPDGSLYWLKAWDNSFRPSSGMLRRIRYTGGPVTVVAPLSERRALQAVPNPFRDRVSIAMAPAAPGPFAITVVDVGGRRIRALGREGSGPLVWDGRDDEDREVAPGLYLIRASDGAAVLTSRVLRLR